MDRVRFSGLLVRVRFSVLLVRVRFSGLLDSVRFSGLLVRVRFSGLLVRVRFSGLLVTFVEKECKPLSTYLHKHTNTETQGALIYLLIFFHQDIVFSTASHFLLSGL